MISQQERELLRNLAKRVKELSELPIMEERREKWYRHNDLETTEPMILVFPEGGWRELVRSDELVCEDQEARYMEWILRARLFRAENINDDSVVENNWEVSKIISNTGWGIRKTNSPVAIANVYECNDAVGFTPQVWRKDFKFDASAHTFQPCIENASDLKKIRTPEVIYNEAATMERLKIHQDILGDILPVQLIGMRYVFFNLMEMYTDHRGLENVLYDLYEEPEMTHEAMSIFENGFRDMIRQYQEMDLLEYNNNHAYNGTGGVGYTHQLPADKENPKSLKNLWACAEAQELTSVSPAQHKEFAMDYEKRLLEPFGLTCYGCCEPLERKMKDVLELPNIRRISVSPWADVESCAEQIKMKAIYSWKPNPSIFINQFEEKFIHDYVMKTLKATHENALEIVLKDTHTCQNDPNRFRRWTDIVRQCIQEDRG